MAAASGTISTIVTDVIRGRAPVQCRQRGIDADVAKVSIQKCDADRRCGEQRLELAERVVITDAIALRRPRGVGRRHGSRHCQIDCGQHRIEVGMIPVGEIRALPRAQDARAQGRKLCKNGRRGARLRDQRRHASTSGLERAVQGVDARDLCDRRDLVQQSSREEGTLPITNELIARPVEKDPYTRQRRGIPVVRH